MSEIKSRKRAGAKIPLVLLSIFLFLLVFAPVATAAIYGDINNDEDVNVQDVVLAVKHALGLELLTEAQKAVGDVNGDGEVDVLDVTLIMQYSLGLIDEFPHAALTVSKVTAVNPKQVEVEFNRMLNAEEKAKMVPANFFVALAETATVDRITGALGDGSAVSVMDDNKTVLLTMVVTPTNATFTNGSTANRVTVRKAVGLDADYVKSDVSFVDTSVPVLVSVHTDSPRSIVMTFSEPIDRTIIPNNITLNGGTIALNLAAPVYVDAMRELRINTFIDLTAGSYTLAIVSGTNLKDYSGFSVAPTSKTFTHTPITTAPTVSIKSSTETNMIIEFSRPIDSDTLVNNASVLFRHTYDSDINQVTGNTAVTNPSGDNSTFLVNFGATKPFPPGTVTVWMKYDTGTADANKIKDTWGNIIAPATFTVTTVPDTTAPTATVSIVSGSNRIIEIQYSKEVDSVQAELASNYVLKKGAVNVPFAGPFIYDAATNKYRITADNAMQGVHTLTISNIKDVTPAQNAMGTQTFTFDVPDTIPPDVVTTAGVVAANFYWQTDNNKVRIFFSEPMNPTDLANKTLYQSINSSNANPTTATPASDGKSVYLVFANNVAGAAPQLRVGPLRDLAGNSLGFATLLTGIVAPNVGLDTSAAVVPNLRATSTTTVQVYLNDIVASATIDDFEISEDNGTSWISPIGIANNPSSGKSVITLTLSAANALVYDAADTLLRTVDEGGAANPTDDAVNQFGLPVDIPATAVVDRIAPVLLTAVVTNASTITLTFSEDLDGGTFALAGSNGFSVSGSTILKAIPDPGDAKIVVITRSGGNNFAATSSTVSYTPGIVADLAGNKLVTISNRQTTNP